MKLSQHFKLWEFQISETAVRNDIDMTPSDEVLERLTRLCVDFLEPLRKELNSPIVITSGYRPILLNTLIGGSSKSSHIEGDAVDFNSIGYKPLEVCRIIRDMELKYDQVIHEFGKWIHWGVGPRKRKEELTAYRQDGKTKYILRLAKIRDLV